MTDRPIALGPTIDPSHPAFTRFLSYNEAPDPDEFAVTLGELRDLRPPGVPWASVDPGLVDPTVIALGVGVPGVQPPKAVIHIVGVDLVGQARMLHDLVCAWEPVNGYMDTNGVGVGGGLEEAYRRAYRETSGHWWRPTKLVVR